MKEKKKIFCFAEVIKERDNSIIEEGFKCSARNVFVQTENFWILRNDSELFKFESYNNTNYLIVCTWYYSIHSVILASFIKSFQ